MHQIRFRLGVRPKPRWGSLQRFPRPPSWIKGVLLLRRREGKGGGEKRGGREGKGRAGEERKGREGERRGGERRDGRKKKGRGGGPSGDVANQTFCLKSAPGYM